MIYLIGKIVLSLLAALGIGFGMAWTHIDESSVYDTPNEVGVAGNSPLNGTR